MKAWKITTPDMLILVFVFFVLLSNLVPIPGLLGNAFISGWGCFCYLYVFYKKRNDKKIWKVTGLAALLSICMITSSLYNHNASLKEVLWIWCYMGAALLLLYFEFDDKWLQMLFYLLSGYFGVCIVMHRSVHYILYSTSRNGISSQKLFVMLLIYLCRGTKKRVIYLPAVLNLVVALWALGRAGVLTGIFFLLGVAAYGIIKDGWKNSWKKLAENAVVLFVSMILLVTIFPTNEWLAPEDGGKEEIEVKDDGQDQTTVVENNKSGQTVKQEKHEKETFVARFASYGFKSVRLSIWMEYLESTVQSIPNLLLGVDCEEGELLSYYRQPHNSYLELHAKFGMIGFLIVMAMLLVTFIRLCRGREGFLLLVLLSCGLRAMLDWAAFPGALDVFFWFLCFYKVFHMGMPRSKEQELLSEVCG